MRCTEILLNAGADPSIPNSGLFTQSPLHDALADAIKFRDLSYNTTPAQSEDYDYMFKRILRASLVDLASGMSVTVGPSIWLSAFAEHTPYCALVEYLMNAGCDINEVTKSFPDQLDGWNCLYLLVQNAIEPESSRAFETLRFLLRRGINALAKDASGMAVFDYINATQPSGRSDYSRDLWHCALQREGIDTGQAVERCPRVVKYGEFYTSEHYYAMCCLDTWTVENLSQQVQDTLTAHPWTGEEALALFHRFEELR